ncbi:trafficking protein particle complex subunit 6A isoform X2 [Sturnira hondurensis]|uniref:trafficking protein particle complex subunit 6A isoform X2 n=1 Tax=Sturnira hondurensis TaxID=192404 RepID=UPI0018798DD3|nr:trafficking protein particle complex subunit 6A isoform X2 [Sturnira hondurensis]
MVDAVLFEFLHTEIVAELWPHEPDPDPRPGEQKMNLLVLESMGFRVGQALGERLPRETLALREELDVLKFLCKDLWVAVFQKQMDSLRTNHQFLAFTCGLLRGTLSTLGIKSLVTASVAALPACRFQVVVQRS